MPDEILINVIPSETRVALIENNSLQEIYIERITQSNLVGNIYKGRINRLLPGIQAAFVDIGLDRAGFLHVSDLHGFESLSKNTTEPLDIREFLQVGEEALVQVYKNPLGSKGARLTTQFTIPSRFLVLTPGVFQINVSQRINDSLQRERFSNLIQPSIHGGYIFRTAAIDLKDDDDLETDRKYLDALWSEIQSKTTTAQSGDILYQEIPLVLRALRDFTSSDITRILVDDLETVESMRDFAAHYDAKLKDKIEFYQEKSPIFDLYSIDEEIQQALQRHIKLKSGGHLIFDQTEAMTTIDVNTGSNIGNKNSAEMIFKTNLEAINILVKQIRLRNLGGIIVIDFIDMLDKEHQTHLVEALKNALAKDSVRSEISDLSSFGIIQMTRKRTRESLEHILCVTCPTCQKRGSIKSLETISYEIFREIKRKTHLHDWPGFLVLASKDVVDYLLNKESAILSNLQIELNKTIKIRSDKTYDQEHFDVLPLSQKEG